jgi:hypothetical protein
MKVQDELGDDESIGLSDDELNRLSGGISHSDDTFGRYLDIGVHAPHVPLLQDRPTANPAQWY